VNAGSCRRYKDITGRRGIFDFRTSHNAVGVGYVASSDRTERRI